MKLLEFLINDAKTRLKSGRGILETGLILGGYVLAEMGTPEPGKRFKTMGEIFNPEGDGEKNSSAEDNANEEQRGYIFGSANSSAGKIDFSNGRLDYSKSSSIPFDFSKSKSIYEKQREREGIISLVKSGYIKPKEYEFHSRISDIPLETLEQARKDGEKERAKSKEYMKSRINQSETPFLPMIESGQKKLGQGSTNYLARLNEESEGIVKRSRKLSGFLKECREAEIKRTFAPSREVDIAIGQGIKLFKSGMKDSCGAYPPADQLYKK